MIKDLVSRVIENRPDGAHVEARYHQRKYTQVRVVIVPGIPMATQELWTALVILVALAITMLMLVIRRDAAYGLVVVWATVGIATKQNAIPIIYFTAIGAALIIALAILLLPLITRKGFGRFYLRSSE